MPEQVLIPPGMTVTAEIWAETTKNFQRVTITWPQNSPPPFLTTTKRISGPEKFGTSSYTNETGQAQYGTVLVENSPDALPGSWGESIYATRETVVDPVSAEESSDHDYNDSEIIFTYS